MGDRRSCICMGRIGSLAPRGRPARSAPDRRAGPAGDASTARAPPQVARLADSTVASRTGRDARVARGSCDRQVLRSPAVGGGRWRARRRVRPTVRSVHPPGVRAAPSARCVPCAYRARRDFMPGAVPRRAELTLRNRRTRRRALHRPRFPTAAVAEENGLSSTRADALGRTRPCAGGPLRAVPPGASRGPRQRARSRSRCGVARPLSPGRAAPGAGCR